MRRGAQAAPAPSVLRSARRSTRYRRDGRGITLTHGGQTTNGHVSELQWYPKESVAYSLLYNAAPRVPGASDLIPRIVLGVPLPEKAR